ncbi:hypothetical protein H4Q26_011419 [Puccinia striiformis f. sp. tritici PST-130]|nr:hypothetical protein H4Q26_011419 [Puccinia striiformis f. sp. tritici PST-130]
MELRITECMKEPSFMKIPDSENPKGSENHGFKSWSVRLNIPMNIPPSQVGYYGCELKGSELLDSTLFLRLEWQVKELLWISNALISLAIGIIVGLLFALILSSTANNSDRNGNGAIHLFKHLMPGNQDPDLDFTGIIDFKGHSPKLSMNTRRSTPETEENNNKGTSSSSDSSKRSSKAMRRKSTGHKYFFAINLYNSFDVIRIIFDYVQSLSHLRIPERVCIGVRERIV